MSENLANKKAPDYFDAFNEGSEAEEASAAAAAKAERENFAKMLGESFKNSNKKLKAGDKITGKILSLGKEEVYVSTGTQHDGVLRKMELLEADGSCNYKTDDLITLYVTQVRGSDIRLSKNPTDRNLAEDLEDAFDMMLPIQGRVAEVCKGGVRVSIKGKLAFCPISQLDSKHVEKADDYVGKSFDFRITKFAEGGKNIVVSRRILMDEERELGTVSFLEENKDGDTVKGKVTRFEKFGAFVELAPGVDGLVHISEIAWSRIGDPSEVLQIGQEVTVKLLKREVLNGKAKISLSIKQSIPKEDRPAAPGQPDKTDPTSKYTVGQILDGKVTRKEPYGFFLEIEPGLNGLLHKSRTYDTPEFKFEKVKVGDVIKVQVAEIKKEERQVALSLPRDPSEDEWKTHQAAAASTATKSLGSLGSLGDQWKAAMAKKKS